MCFELDSRWVLNARVVLWRPPSYHLLPVILKEAFSKEEDLSGELDSEIHLVKEMIAQIAIPSFQ